MAASEVSEDERQIQRMKQEIQFLREKLEERDAQAETLRQATNVF